MDIVILGMGAAGLAALEHLRRTEQELGSGPANVTVVAPEEGFPYSLCALPFSLCGELAECFLDRCDPDYLTLHGASRVSGKVTSVDTGGRRVLLDSGSSLPYDKLLVATGSVPFVPPVPGLDLPGVHFLASLSDSQGIREWVDRGNTRCVVIGAGFVGIEAAVALAKLGCTVTVVEMLTWVLPRVFDEDAAAVAQRHLEAGGIDFRLGAQVTEVLPCDEGTVDAVMVGDERIECDTVVVGIGVRPNIKFLEGPGSRPTTGSWWATTCRPPSQASTQRVTWWRRGAATPGPPPSGPYGPTPSVRAGSRARQWQERRCGTRAPRWSTSSTSSPCPP